MTPSLHATCLLVGADGVLIRGRSGAGKTTLALAMIDHVEGRQGFARLVADDRVHVEARHGRLLAEAPPALFGLAERRGLGVVPIKAERAAILALVVDIDAENGQRLPDAAMQETAIDGVVLRRIVVQNAGQEAVALVLAALGTKSGG